MAPILKRSKSQSGTGEERDRIRRLVGAGMEMLGSSGSAVISAALGLLLAGPPGVAVGGAVGAVVSMSLKKLGNEISNRLLSAREETRVGYVLASGAAQIRRRIEAGEVLRTDGFFDAKQTNRSEAEEVAESVLLKSQREPEEKKLPYLANLLANVAFDTQISAELAHQAAKTAEQLTYSQLCILQLAVFKDHFKLRRKDYRGQGSFSKQLYSPLYECLDLYHRGLINFGGTVAFGPTDVNPGSMTVQGLGADIYNQMNLSAIPLGDVERVAVHLR